MVLECWEAAATHAAACHVLLLWPYILLPMALHHQDPPLPPAFTIHAYACLNKRNCWSPLACMVCSTAALPRWCTPHMGRVLLCCPDLPFTLAPPGADSVQQLCQAGSVSVDQLDHPANCLPGAGRRPVGAGHGGLHAQARRGARRHCGESLIKRQSLRGQGLAGSVV